MINLINQGCLEFYYFKGCNNLSFSSESIPIIDQRNTSKRLRTLQKGFLPSVQKSVHLDVQCIRDSAVHINHETRGILG